MQHIDRKFIIIGTLVLILGMVHGVAMGMIGDYTFHQLHAHMNLLGGFGLILFGLFYKAYPAAQHDPLAKWHFWIAISGIALFIIGIYIAVKGIDLGGTDVIPGTVGGLMVVLTFVLFLIIAARQTKGPQ